MKNLLSLFLLLCLLPATGLAQDPHPLVSIEMSLKQIREAQILQQEALQQLVDQEAAASTAGALEELTETPVPDAAETAEHRKLIEEQVQRAQHVLEHPLVKDLLKLVGTPAYLQAMDSIQKHPNLRLLFKVEIGILIFIFLLRAWLFSRPSHWLRKIWTRTWTLALLFVAGSVIAPSLILGSLYGEVLGPLLKAFWNHFTR